MFPFRQGWKHHYCGHAAGSATRSVTSYIELDTASALRNKFIVNFYTENNMDDPLITAAVPAESGRCFVLVIQGFRNYATRRIAVGKNESNELVYDNVFVSPKLRVNIRATY